MALLDPAIRRSTAWHTGLAGVATLLIVSVPVAAVQLASPPSAPPTRDALVARALAGNLIDLAGDGEIGGITAMLDAGADVNATVRGDGSPLIAAAGDGHLEAVALLLDRGANINLAVQGDGSALIAAAGDGHLDVVRLLLDRGADVNQAVEGDGTALIAAAGEGYASIVQLLLDRGADINQIVEGDENALITASADGHLDVVKLLVSQGADVHARVLVDVFTYDRGVRYVGQEWRSALSVARKENHTAVVQFLQSVGARD